MSCLIAVTKHPRSSVRKEGFLGSQLEGAVRQGSAAAGA